jgi:ribonuclease R
MSDELSNRILRFVGDRDYRPAKVRALARAMGVAEKEYGRFRDAVKGLMASGRIVLGSGNAVVAPELPGRIIGTFRANPRGFGFVIPENPTGHGDLYIPEGAGGDAITGDTVLCRVLKKGKRGGKMVYEGRIERVLQRGRSQFVGELIEHDGRFLVMPDGHVLHVPIEVVDVTAGTAHVGEKVVVEIESYPTIGRPARGVIVERLGEAGQPDAELRSIIRQYQIPDRFSDEALAEAREVVDRFNAEGLPGDRLDLRDETIITIDPEDARDFDDAISLRCAGEEYELGVHIADVACFVREGGALDADARLRGNSTYFPRHVVPMLPELLSNGVCSLQQDADRLSKSVFIRYDERGNVLAARVANSVIRSAARLTYQRAQQIIDGKRGGCPAAVADLLVKMDRLARILQHRRLKDGMLILDLPEVELEMQDGRVVDAHPADDSFTHTIIEMFMVEANEAVARTLGRQGVPVLLRVHPEPVRHAAAGLARFVRVLGHTLPAAMGRRDLQRLLESVRGRPESYAVSMAVLRSLEQAEYSPQPIGHFALASECYTHFTSPIRRYPDLTVHRLVQHYLDGQLDSAQDRSVLPGEDELAELGRHCSFTERRSEDAEREMRTVLVLQFLEDHPGEEWDGVVTGVTEFGVYVQLQQFLIDGLMRFTDLPDDWWDVHADRGYVVGERTGRRLAIGDALRVRILGVHVPQRHLDLAWVTAAKTKTRQQKKAGKSVRRRRR